MVQIRNTESIIESFHDHYYTSGLREKKTWNDTHWLGYPIYKCPNDLIIYQEIIYELKPDVIIETGTADGGSALYLACLCDLIGRGSVITVDIASEYNKVTYPGKRPEHPRITYLTGSSIAPEIIRQLQQRIKPSDKVLVILDSDHHQAHVQEELRLYCQFVTVGSYLVVEDTNINGHPVYPEFGPGPMEAVEVFLKEDDRFVIDREREKLLLTFNPNGYLKRIS